MSISVFPLFFTMWGVLINEILEKDLGEKHLHEKYLGGSGDADDSVNAALDDVSSQSEQLHESKDETTTPRSPHKPQIQRLNRYGVPIQDNEKSSNIWDRKGTRTQLVRKLLAKAEAYCAPTVIEVSMRKVERQKEKSMAEAAAEYYNSKPRAGALAGLPESPEES